VDENYGAVKADIFIRTICPIILDNGKCELSIIFDT